MNSRSFIKNAFIFLTLLRNFFPFFIPRSSIKCARARMSNYLENSLLYRANSRDFTVESRNEIKRRFIRLRYSENVNHQHVIRNMFMFKFFTKYFSNVKNFYR